MNARPSAAAPTATPEAEAQTQAAPDLLSRANSHSEPADAGPTVVPVHKQAPKASLLRLSLLVASSALLSGIAVVLWNRRALETMRRENPGAAEAPLPEPGQRQAAHSEGSEFI